MSNYQIPQPDSIYQLFRALNNVPRPSWHEEKVADWLCQFAKSNALDYQRDAHNCVVIRKPASPGKEQCEPIVLHAHMDMVCVAEKGKDFDPLTSPIEAYIDNGWMKARGTSLGADNGMGLCMAMAVMQDKTLTHGPLELLVTTNEEDGMTGAANLSEDFVKARKMIDLDSEDYDTITVGAAGAYLQTASLPISFIPSPDDAVFAQISIHGGLGGHSGVDINKQRMSAVKEICLLA
ncbi:MAG: M20/M25/M40 family metallo-hydrolase, partial [Prevotella sp.]|nr:M20/M25/M40 family metallo-hydrolase [Prevotella sp.]